MSLGYKFSWSEMDLLAQRWENFAIKHAGEFKIINSHSFSNISDPTLRKFELKIPFENGQITFLTTEIKPLKVSYSFNRIIPNEFLIYNEDYFDKILKHFGLNELEIGDPDFDNKFIIKGNNEFLLRKILTKEWKTFLQSNYLANFKLEKVEVCSVLELNISINELEVSNLAKIAELFKDIISIIQYKCEIE